METIKNKIKELEKSRSTMKKNQAQCQSDMLYWSYVAEIENLDNQIAKLKTDLKYEEIIQGLDDIFGETDTVKEEFKKTLVNIILEHKQLKYKN